MSEPKVEVFGKGGVKDAIIKFYERVQKGESIPRSEWDSIKQTITDNGNALSERIKSIVTQAKTVKADMNGLKTKMDTLREQAKDLEADKRAAIENLMLSYESEIQALQVGEMAAWKLQDSHDATIGVVAARWEQGVNRKVDISEADAMKRAVELLEEKFPGVTASFEDTLKRVVASKTTLEETTELVITTTMPTVGGIKKPGDVGEPSESLRATLKSTGLDQLVETPKFVGDAWEKVRSVWGSVVSFIKGVVADVFGVSADVDAIAAESEEVTKLLR